MTVQVGSNLQPDPHCVHKKAYLLVHQKHEDPFWLFPNSIHAFEHGPKCTNQGLLVSGSYILSWGVHTFIDLALDVLYPTPTKTTATGMNYLDKRESGHKHMLWITDNVCHDLGHQASKARAAFLLLSLDWQGFRQSQLPKLRNMKNIAETVIMPNPG